MGRFLSVDPLWASFPDQTPCQYGYNNPVMFKDPSGLAPEIDTDKGKAVSTYCDKCGYAIYGDELASAIEVGTHQCGGGIFSVEKTEEKDGMEYIIIRGKGIENNSSEQEIVRFEADIYLGDSTSFTVLTSTQTPNECYRIAPSKATISMGGCFIDARTVTTGQPYMMTSRIENDMLIIDYTAGLTGSTECVLLNSLGENVATVYNQRDEQGKYRIDYPVAGMANGYYILVFRSGIYQTSHVVNLMR